MSLGCFRLSFVFLSALVACLTSPALCLAAEEKEPQISFTKDIAPIFVKSCFACHNQKTQKGKYDMSSYESLMKAGSKGNDIVPGQPYESLVVLMMYGDEIPSMPKEADLLDEAVVAKVDLWVKQGAKFDGKDPKQDLRELVPQKSTPVVDKNYTIPTPATALAFSPDGKELAVAGYHEITFWNAETGALLRRLPTKSQRIHELRYSPKAESKQLLHAGGTPGTFGEVVVWDLNESKPIRELIEIDDILFAAAFSPDGEQVAAAGTDRLFRIWDLKEGKLLHAVENHADWILDLTFSADGNRLFTAGRDKSVKVWDKSTQEPILTFPSHSDGVYGVAVSPDGKTAYSTGADKTLRFWTPEGNGKQTRSVNAHNGTSHTVLFSPTANLLFTAGADNLVKAWDPKNGKQVRVFSGHSDWVYSLAFSPDEKTLASGSWNGEIFLWDVATGKPRKKFVAVPALAGK